MKIRDFRRSLWLPRPVDEVFPFFADAANLAILTPDWLDFRIVTPKVEMAPGAEIRYRLRLHGIPLSWVSRITRWDPPRVFVDEQVRGPYRLWVHEHRFEPENGGTSVSDHVRYAVWGGALVDRWMVAPDLERIFRRRTEKLLETFGPAHMC